MPSTTAPSDYSMTALAAAAEHTKRPCCCKPIPATPANSCTICLCPFTSMGNTGAGFALAIRQKTLPHPKPHPDKFHLRDYDEPMTIITPEPVWKARRDWIKRMGASAALTGGVAAIPGLALAARQNSESPASLPATPHPDYQIDARLTAESDVTQYNNFYEFGTGKSDPYRHAHRMDTEPWTVRVEGEVHRPATWSIDDLIKLAPQEERIYRLRCVEGWSMVIPWIGYSLSVLLK